MTVSVGRLVSRTTPPTGDAGVGADNVPGGGGGGAAAAVCVMVKVVTATVIVPLRAAPPFAATENVTVPLPLPEAPCVMLTKLALLVAVHVHPVPAVTGTDPEPPSAPNDDALICPVAIVQVEGVVGVGVWFLHAPPENAASVATTPSAMTRAG